MQRFATCLLATLLFLAASAHAQSWRYTGSLHTERRMFTMTLLHDGRVLAAGGTNRNHACLNSCELFDPMTEIWSETAPMMVPRERHTATLLENGKVVVIGGNIRDNSHNVVTAGVEIYDPASDTWSSGGTLLLARQNHTATLLNDGTILVTGGYNNGQFLDECEIYNPAAMRARVVAPLNLRRMDHEAVLLKSGEVMVAGGRIGGWDGDYLNHVEVYTPATGRWRAIAPMFQSRITGFSLVCFSDGTVLAAGGRNSPTSSAPGSEVLDPITMTWRDVEPMKVPCAWEGGIALPFDLYMITGGFYDAVWQSSNLVTATPTCEWYDKWHGRWYYAPKLNMQRAEHCALYLHDCGNPLLPREVMLVAGGITGDNAITSTAEVLDITEPARASYMARQEALASAPPQSLPDANHFTVLRNVGATPGVRFALTSPAPVHIDLVTIDGRTVRTVVDATYPEGVHIQRIDVAGIPSGTYFVRMHSGMFSATERMVLTH